MNKEISEKAHLRSDFRKKEYLLEWGSNPRKYYIFRAAIEKFFVRFLVQVKISISPFEINWPLMLSLQFGIQNFLVSCVYFTTCCRANMFFNFMLTTYKRDTKFLVCTWEIWTFCFHIMLFIAKLRLWLQAVYYQTNLFLVVRWHHYIDNSLHRQKQSHKQLCKIQFEMRN